MHFSAMALRFDTPVPNWRSVIVVFCAQMVGKPVIAPEPAASRRRGAPLSSGGGDMPLRFFHCSHSLLSSVDAFPVTLDAGGFSCPLIPRIRACPPPAIADRRGSPAASAGSSKKSPSGNDGT